MKKMELSQMENLQGGELSPECKAEIGLSAVVGGMLGGPWGYVIGGVSGYLLSDKC